MSNSIVPSFSRQEMKDLYDLLLAKLKVKYPDVTENHIKWLAAGEWEVLLKQYELGAVKSSIEFSINNLVRRGFSFEKGTDGEIEMSRLYPTHNWTAVTRSIPVVARPIDGVTV